MKPKIVLKPTHIYRDKPVEYLRSTYEDFGQQYCVILMTNKHGQIQRQTIQERHLTPLAVSTPPATRSN